jgi:SAM-dependent methyltransferase
MLRPTVVNSVLLSMEKDQLRISVSVSRYAHLLICPACSQAFGMGNGSLVCSGCHASFAIQSGIPLLSWPREGHSPGERLTGRVRSFYETNPFPDYEGTEDLASLLQKARESIFARLLDEQIPFGVRVLECGCGTGQLSNFLGIAHRTVFGSDLSLSSLNLAEKFRREHRLDRVFFLQMNIFSPVFPEKSFDYVICNGVLHHTYDPQRGFELLSRLVRPGGYLIIGLYHRFGRLMTDLRRQLFKVSGESLSFLDPRLRRSELGKERRSAWFEDQYRNPHESKHTVSEVLKWVDRAGLRFIKSIPKTRVLSRFSVNEELFQEEAPGPAPERFLSELSLAFRSDPEGGFFTVIAQKVT